MLPLLCQTIMPASGKNKDRTHTVVTETFCRACRENQIKAFRMPFQCTHEFMCLVVYGVQRYRKSRLDASLIKQNNRGNSKNEHKKSYWSTSLLFSSVNNKVEIHLKCRLATTLAKSKFDIFDTGKKHSFSFPQKILSSRASQPIARATSSNVKLNSRHKSNIESSPFHLRCAILSRHSSQFLSFPSCKL